MHVINQFLKIRVDLFALKYGLLTFKTDVVGLSFSSPSVRDMMTPTNYHIDFHMPFFNHD